MELRGVLIGLLLQWVHWGYSLGTTLHSQSQSQSHHYCYTELVRALATSCDRIYAAGVDPSGNSRRGRRSVGVSGRTELVRRRLPRNVVEQCCKNPCNVATLQRYCSIVRENRRNSGPGQSLNGTSRESDLILNGESSSTIRTRAQPLSSSTPSPSESDSEADSEGGGGLSTFQRLTEPPLPEPVPVGDFETQFY